MNNTLKVVKVQYSDNVMDVEDFSRVAYVADAAGRIIHKAVVNAGIYGGGSDFSRLGQLHEAIDDANAANDKGRYPEQYIDIAEVTYIRFSDFLAGTGISCKQQ